MDNSIKVITLFAVIMLASFLAGCANTTQLPSQEALASVTIGQTTYDDVLTSFGPPTRYRLGSEGSQVLTYARSGPRLVGTGSDNIFRTGATLGLRTGTETVTLVFSDGILQSIETEEVVNAITLIDTTDPQPNYPEN